MIKRPSKAEIRESLSAEMNDFLNKGGEVQQYEQGESSLIDGKYDRNQFVYGLPKQQRTPLSDTLNVIDNRKSVSKKASPTSIKRRRKKIIYDDFGEPLREVWVEE